MSEPTPDLEHWPTERMINEGHAEYATEADLEGLSQPELANIAQICIVNEFAPDECIPCKAHVLYLEQVRESTEEAEQRLADLSPDLTLQETQGVGEKIQEDLAKALEQPLDARLLGGEEWEAPGGPNRHADPVREIARQAGYLQKLVEEMLDGPPIPPREVSVDDLALLVVAAQRWIRMTDAQGVELSPAQAAILDSTRSLVARLHRG